MENMAKQEANRQAHEQSMLRQQAELIAFQAEKDKKRKLTDKMEPWRDSDQTDAYFQRFEKTMGDAGIPQGEWVSRLIPLLTGRSLKAYHKRVSGSASGKYADFKEALRSTLESSALKFSEEVHR